MNRPLVGEGATPGQIAQSATTTRSDTILCLVVVQNRQKHHHAVHQARRIGQIKGETRIDGFFTPRLRILQTRSQWIPTFRSGIKQNYCTFVRAVADSEIASRHFIIQVNGGINSPGIPWIHQIDTKLKGIDNICRFRQYAEIGNWFFVALFLDRDSVVVVV